MTETIPETDNVVPKVSIQPPSGRNNFLFSVVILLTAIFAFLGAQVLGPIMVAIVGYSFGSNQHTLTRLIDSNTYVRFATILLIEVITVWLVSLFLKRRKQTFASIGLGRKPQFSDLRTGLLTYGSYFLLYLVIVTAVSASGLINTQQPQQLGFTQTHGVELLFVFFSLVLLPPIAEEILFRGYIYMGLRKRLSPYTAGAITSVLFSIAHLEFGSGVGLNYAAALDTFILSCVLVYITEKTKSLWPAMVVHATKNLIAFLALFVIK